MCGIFLYFHPTAGGVSFASVAVEFEKTRHRGPDNSTLKMLKTSNGGMLFIGFHRLAIMDPTGEGDQPFEYRNTTCICNGEIYNFREVSKSLEEQGLYRCKSRSDCEIILPLYSEYGIERTCNLLDGEFAFIIYDHINNLILAGCDFLRTRPLFVGYGLNGAIALASEVKSIQSLQGITEVKPFPPGCWWSSAEPMAFNKYATPFESISMSPSVTDLANIQENIVRLFTKAVKKRLLADQEIGFFLSGGLDSSLCCYVASQLRTTEAKPLMTFTASFSETGPDLLAAREVAKKIASTHHEVLFTIEQGLAAIPRTIRALESYCCTTVRASVPQLLLAEWIQQKYPNIKVMISGENSDETFCGYEYFKYAPTSEASHSESVKLLNNVHLYDALRADRTVASVGMELRVPFTDRALVEYVLSLDPELVRAPTPEQMKTNLPGQIPPTFIEKKILRDAFKDIGLPPTVLYRSKMGLSDSCSLSWVDHIKSYASQVISDEQFEQRIVFFPHDPPRTKEEFLYRRIFEQNYPGKATLIKSHWMPNPEWFDVPLTDPSARVIATFAQSGTDPSARS
jgi:asparagine synthase (glutamine-hydrolysing)